MADLYDIVMCVPGMAFEGDTLERKSLGGSETAGLYMAREFARLGHHVTVFSNTTRPGMYEKVTYRPISEFAAYVRWVPHDVCIMQRAVDPFTARLASRLNLLWCHDLALRRQADPFRGTLWNIDAVVVLSQFMKEQYREVYGLPEEILWVTRNGVDTARVAKLGQPPRDRKRLMYAARPERGLDVLLNTILPKLVEADPEITLGLAGYENTTPQMVEFYQQVEQRIASWGARVQWLGYLTKDQLYSQYLRAGVYVYPTPSPIMPAFAEISCITAMECQAAGLPIVATDRGALRETIGEGAGTLVTGDPQSPEYQEQFVEAVLRYVRDEGAWQAASTAGRHKAATLEWGAVAQEWLAQIERMLAERNDSPMRLARHFLRHSDVLMAQDILKDDETAEAQELRGTIAQTWGFAASPEDRHAQYERIASTHGGNFEAWSTQEPRFQFLKQWFAAHPEVKRVLDMGCAYGGYTITLANEVGQQWVGVDVSETAIRWATQYAVEHAKTPEALQFLVGDEHLDLSSHAPFDLVWIGETLEHVPDPTAFLQAVERWVAPGGHIILSTPFGPWEYASYRSYPHRAHLWEFDRHDLTDLVGKKRKMQITCVPAGRPDPYLDESLGWYMTEWTVDATKPTGQIDRVRKRRLQRPRQTVSANIMAGPDAEEMLHWTLRSVRDVVDELVIVDTGMSDEGRRIAVQYGAKLIPGPNPQVDGFETPRNVGLQHCRMDWVLWIDTDEKLVDPHATQKYLRHNIFTGYGIRQHHFAVDTTHKPDLPVRFFRRAPYKGKTMRWFGMIHEHPEHGMNEGPGPIIVMADAHIAHPGYLSEHVRRQRFARNFPLLKKDIETYPERLLQKHLIMRDNMLIAMYEAQQNGGRVTDNMRRLARETIELYRTHFLGKGWYLNNDSLHYYSQAVSILGEGFEAAFQVAAGKDKANPNGTNVYRFATPEDFEKELLQLARQQTEAFGSKYW